MKLTRIRKTTYEVECPQATPIFNFGEFKSARERRGTMKSYFNKCFVCGKPFADADDAYIAAVLHVGNRLVCKACNGKAREETERE